MIYLKNIRIQGKIYRRKVTPNSDENSGFKPQIIVRYAILFYFPVIIEVIYVAIRKD